MKTWVKLKTKYLIFCCSISCLGFVLLLLLPKIKHHIPSPTDGTFVKEDMEEKSLKSLKHKWLEEIHSAAPGTDWRIIEYQNSLKSYQEIVNRLNQGIVPSKDGEVDIANGSVVAEWEEKGSINQAGSIINAVYNRNDEKIYAISAGGSIWKSDMSGINWQVVNQDLRFDGRFFIIAYLPNGTTRFVSSINGHPYYSDGGLEWQSCNTFSENTIPVHKNVRSINDGKHIFMLSKARSGENVKLYHSDDYGQTFHPIKTFLTADPDNMAIAAINDRLFVIEQKSISSSRVYEWDAEEDQLDILVDNSPISFGVAGKGNLTVIENEGLLFMFAYDGNNKLKRSYNFGVDWTTVGTLPKTPWEDGFFISNKYPNIMMVGEIEAYRSVDGGQTWTRVNRWYEYYANRITKLHADIMSFKEYENDNGSFMLVGNHGGLSISYNSGSTFANIGLSGLNVSQYYDIATYPSDDEYLFAGSQDQGLQRSRDLGEGPAYYEQIISGDYGHLQFSNDDKSLWAVFPGGWISYYEDPVASQDHEYSDYFENVGGRQSSIWLPPIITSPYHHNAVILAGGDIQDQSGSHLIHLKVSDFGFINAEQWPFDFGAGGDDISAMAANHFNDKEFYVLTKKGKFYKSTNYGQHFTEKTNAIPNAHYLYGSSILCSRLNEDVLYITGSGYSNAPVFKSIDGGETFQPFSTGLPPTTVFNLAPNANESLIFAATEAGPYLYIRDKSRWFPLAEGIAPNQTYWNVEFLEDKQMARFATYGRGIWEFKLKESTNINDLDFQAEVQVVPNPASSELRVSSTGFEGQIHVMSYAGHIISSHKLAESNTLILDISHYINGLYYIIFDDEKQLSSKSFVKI